MTEDGNAEANDRTEQDLDADGNLATALDFAHEFRELLRRAISAKVPPPRFASSEGVLNVTIQFLTAAIHGSFVAIVLLCREGWGVEAGVLLRQLQEGVVNARAMKRNRSVLFLFVEAFERRSERARTASSPSQIPDDMLPTTILGIPAKSDEVAWYQSGKSNGKRRRWKDLSMETRVRLADLDTSVWYRVYRDLCDIAHVGPGGMHAYLHEHDWGTLWFGRDRKRAVKNLGSACGLLILHLGTLDGIFSLGMWHEIEELGRRMLKSMKDERTA